MDQRVSMITLPVADVPAARGFGVIVSLWWRDKLDADGGVADRGGYGHAALAYAVDDLEAVEAVCREAVQAGATITRAPVEKPFGYSGVFADPDGHTWEVAWVRGWTVDGNGATTLPI